MARQRIRKPLRLAEYDYSTPGYYFVTVCTKNRECLLCDLNACRGAQCAPASAPPNRTPFLLTKIGSVVDGAIQNIPLRYPAVCVDKYVIMPNHIHMILVIQTSDAQNGRTLCAPTVSRVIKHMKESVTKQLHVSIWQRSFYDHIIRNEAEYLNIWNYIDTNPQKWQDDCYYKG